MLKKLLLFVLFIPLIGFSQDTIKGHMRPAKDFSYVILYKLHGANQKYVTNTTIKDGDFTLVIPKGSETGMYRISYDNIKNLYIEVLYNHENIEMEFNPEHPNNLVKYKTSQENILFQSYINSIYPYHNALDSIQTRYFQTKDIKEETKLKKLYQENLVKAKAVQDAFETSSKGKLANTFIKSSKRYYSKELIKDTSTYLASLKEHYFDYLDFDNPQLVKSSVVMENVINYIMYLNTSKDRDMLLKMRKEAITTALGKIKNLDLNKNITESLLYLFGQQQEKELVDYLFTNHYYKLPVKLRDFTFEQEVKDLFKTSIGQPAPNIEWDVYGKHYNMAKMQEYDYYLVVFWSSTCSHCAKEIPLLNEYVSTIKNIKVLAIGLEDEASKAGWKEETFEFENLTHILGLGRWKSKYSRDYGVVATPSYYLLDKDKKIIAKPYDLKELKKVLSKAPKK